MWTFVEDCITFYFCQISTPCPVRVSDIHILSSTVKGLFYPAYKLLLWIVSWMLAEDIRFLDQRQRTLLFTARQVVWASCYLNLASQSLQGQQRQQRVGLRLIVHIQWAHILDKEPWGYWAPILLGTASKSAQFLPWRETSLLPWIANKPAYYLRGVSRVPIYLLYLPRLFILHIPLKS